MTHQAMVCSAVVVGGVIAMFAGRIYAQMEFEQEEKNQPAIPRSVAAFFGVVAALVGHHFFGLKGELLFVLAIPAYWLTPIVAQIVGTATEFQEETPSYRRKSAAEARQSSLNCSKGVGLVFATFSALLACGIIADIHGVIGAVLAVAIVAPLCAVPAMGAFYSLVGLIMLGVLIVIRTFRKVEQLAHRVGLIGSNS